MGPRRNNGFPGHSNGGFGCKYPWLPLTRKCSLSLENHDLLHPVDTRSIARQNKRTGTSTVCPHCPSSREKLRLHVASVGCTTRQSSQSRTDTRTVMASGKWSREVSRAIQHRRRSTARNHNYMTWKLTTLKTTTLRTNFLR